MVSIYMPILLELFSGTGSVGEVAKNLGWHVVSLDRHMPADLHMDVMDWITSR